MAQSTIDFNDKVTGDSFTADNANEIKSVVNDNASDVIQHKQDVSNPHFVVASQLGLGNVDNTSDADKPVSTAQQTALDLKANLASPVFTGNVTSGGGMFFNGDTADANKLDDYEEGTWTPAVTSTGVAPSITYTAQHGYYTKTGNICNFQLHLHFEITVAGSGTLRASIPFLAASLSGNWQHIRAGYSVGQTNTEAFAIPHNTSIGELYSVIDTADNASVTGTRIFVINGSYIAA